MSAVIEDAIAEIQTTAVATLSLSATQMIARDVRLERVPWRKMLEAGTLNAPWHGLIFGRHEPSEYSPVDKLDYEIPVKFVRVIHLAEATLPELTASMEALRDAFKPPATFTNFAVLWPPEVDVSESNVANALFLGDGYPLLGGTIDFRIYVTP